MHKESFADPLKAWGEAKQKLTDAFNLMRQALGKLSGELEETEGKLNQVVSSVDGTLEKLGIESREEQR